MHVFGLATNHPAAFTVAGSINVVFAGAVAGALGGILLTIIQRFLPQLRWLRGVLFAVICYLISKHAVKPNAAQAPSVSWQPPAEAGRQLRTAPRSEQHYVPQLKI
jgi:hypothetical protein